MERASARNADFSPLVRRRRRSGAAFSANLTEFVLTEKTELASGQLIFAREGASEQHWIVGVQHDRHAGVEQAGAADARGSDATAPVRTLLVTHILERDVPLAQVIEQLGDLRPRGCCGRCSLGSDFERIPHRLRTSSFRPRDRSAAARDRAPWRTDRGTTIGPGLCSSNPPRPDRDDAFVDVRSGEDRIPAQLLRRPTGARRRESSEPRTGLRCGFGRELHRTPQTDPVSSTKTTPAESVTPRVASRLRAIAFRTSGFGHQTRNPRPAQLAILPYERIDESFEGGVIELGRDSPRPSLRDRVPSVAASIRAFQMQVQFCGGRIVQCSFLQVEIAPAIITVMATSSAE